MNIFDCLQILYYIVSKNSSNIHYANHDKIFLIKTLQKMQY